MLIEVEVLPQLLNNLQLSMLFRFESLPEMLPWVAKSHKLPDWLLDKTTSHLVIILFRENFWQKNVAKALNSLLLELLLCEILKKTEKKAFLH